MKNLTKLIVITAFIAVITMTVCGCATRIMDLTVASTQNVDLNRMGEFRRTATEVKGTSTKLTRILFFDVAMGNIDMEQAIDRALRKIPGAVALVNFVLTKRYLNFLLFSLEQYTVTGNALVDPNIITHGNNGEFLPELVTFDETGKIIERIQITQDEYNQYLAIAEYMIIE